MSMKMCKRLSLSQPWGLNRSLHEKDPLGSTPHWFRGDQTRRSDQPDSRHPSVRSWITIHVSPLHMLTARSQQSSFRALYVMIGRASTKTGRVDQYQSTRAHATAKTTSDAPLPLASRLQIICKKVPER